MSDLAIFIVGFLLTVAIGGAMAVVIRAAIADGQTQRDWEARIAADSSRATAAVAQPLPRTRPEVPVPRPR